MNNNIQNNKIKSWKINTFLILVLSAISSISYSQEEKPESDKGQHKYEFVNQTEFNLLAGNDKFYNYSPNYINGKPVQTVYGLGRSLGIGLSTFNGFKIKPRTLAGLTVGIDEYSGIILIPIMASIRQDIAKKEKSAAKFIGTLDMGWGFGFANPKSDIKNVAGGLIINPAIGFKFPTRNHSAWLFTLGYKFQHAQVNESTTYDYDYTTVTSYNYKRMQVKVGFQF